MRTCIALGFRASCCLWSWSPSSVLAQAEPKCVWCADAVDAIDLARLQGIDTRDIQVPASAGRAVRAKHALPTDCDSDSLLQRYSINEKDVVFLRTRAWRSRQPLNSVCKSCSRPLKTASCSFCSLQCKLDGPASAAAASLGREHSAASQTSSADHTSPKRKYAPRLLHSC